jgi:SAM-dependent methyltransferase
MANLQRRFWHVFHSPNTLRAYREFDARLARTARGADVLSVGCWRGEECASYAAFSPRRLVGIDVADEGISEARRSFGHLAEFHAMDAHRMDFPDASFDLVVGKAILHHLEYERAMSEVARILRPGGYAMFLEPLRGNPMGKLVRALTPLARTADECPLDRRQILWADRKFGEGHHLWINFLTVPVGMLTTQVFSSPNNWPLRACDVIDGLITRTPLRYWMRYVGLIWRKVR